MIIDELSSLPLPVQSTDELPIERGELAYKVTYNNLVGNEIAGVKSNITTLQGNVTTLQNADSKIESSIAIIVNGNTTSTTISAGQYVYIKGSTILSEGLYTANSAVPSGTTVSSTYFTAVSGGGLNAIQQSMADVYSTTAVKTPAKWLNGNHIYRRVYPIDSLPNNATIQIPHGITSQQSIIAYSGLCYKKTDRNMTRPLPFGTGDSNGIRIDTGPSTIYVITKADWTTYAGYVILEYVDN